MLSYRQIFGGNVDENTPEYNFLHPHIEATYIRFHPWTWHSHISMRAEVYGCNGNLLLVGSIHSKSGIFQDTKYKYNFVIESNGAFCFRFFFHFLVLFFSTYSCFVALQRTSILRLRRNFLSIDITT